jgi:hypothetical protein
MVFVLASVNKETVRLRSARAAKEGRPAADSLTFQSEDGTEASG